MVFLNSTPRLVIVGASGHGLVVADIVRCSARFEVVGFLDSGKPVGPGPAGLPIFGSVEAAAELAKRHGFTDCLVAVGHNDTRRRCVERLAALMPELRFPAVVHPSAVVADGVVLGMGTVVMAGAVLNPGCVIGRHCILNTGCRLDHESRLGDFASLAPGVVTGGNVLIGEGAAIGLGASIIHGMSIGRETVIGAGAVVVKDIPANVVAMGVPARVTRKRQSGEKYL